MRVAKRPAELNGKCDGCCKRSCRGQVEGSEKKGAVRNKLIRRETHADSLIAQSLNFETWRSFQCSLSTT